MPTLPKLNIKLINNVNQIVLFCLLLSFMTSRSAANYFSGILAIWCLFLCAKKIDQWSFANLFQKYGKINIFWISWLSFMLLGYVANKKLGSVQINEIIEHRWILLVYIFALFFRKTTFSQLFIKATSISILLIYICDWVLYFTKKDWVFMDSNTNRMSGFFPNPNDLGHSNMVICLALLGIAIFSIYIKKEKYTFVTALALISIGSTYLTFTRMAWAGAAIGGFIILTGILKRKVIPILIAFALAITIFFAFDLVHFRERIMFSLNPTKTYDSQRLVLWDINFKIFKEHPVLGVGYYENVRDLSLYYKKYGVPDSQFKAHAHNQYINYLSGTGLVGLTFYLAIWVWFLIQNISALKSSLYAEQKWLLWTCLGIQVGFLVGGLAECNFEMPLARFLLLIIWAIILNASIKTKQLYKLTL